MLSQCGQPAEHRETEEGQKSHGIGRHGDENRTRNSGILIEPVTRAQVLIPRDAHRRFGKGNHPAGLNFGDCFAYALATERGLPLLFKGDDFARTDLESAL